MHYFMTASGVALILFSSCFLRKGLPRLLGKFRDRTTNHLTYTNIRSWFARLFAVLLNALLVSVPQQAALVHLGFNLIKSCVSMLLLLPIQSCVHRFLPERRSIDKPAGNQMVYIDHLNRFKQQMAISFSRREILRVSEMVRHMFSSSWRAIHERDL